MSYITYLDICERRLSSFFIVDLIIYVLYRIKMRVFFLINKFLSGKNFGKTKDIVGLGSSLRRKGLVRLRRKNFKKFSSILVHSGNIIKKKDVSKKKLLSFHFKIKKVSNIKLKNFFNKFRGKKFSFNLSFYYNNLLYKHEDYNFLNNVKSYKYFYNCYFKHVVNINLNDINFLTYSSFNKDLILNKEDFTFFNSYSYTLEKNELNFLCNNNLYESDLSSFFFKKINFLNFNNFVLENFEDVSSKEGSYLNQLQKNSFFFSSLFRRRLFFEKNQFSNFFQKKYSFDVLFFKNFFFNPFNFKSKLISFNYNNDFIYKYLKGKGKKFYISYYSKLNNFFFNLKKNELLYKKASKKLFLKKYNMLKLYINDLIPGFLSKNLLLGFIFKSNFIFANSNFSYFFNENENFFNTIYSNKKQIFSLIDFKDSFYYSKFKNYLSFSFYKQTNSYVKFMNFFIYSLNFIKNVPLFSNLLQDIFYTYNYLKLLRIKQLLEYFNFNLYFIFKKFNLTKFTSLNNSFFSNIYKNYIPFFYDFMFKNYFKLCFQDFYVLVKDFKNINNIKNNINFSTIDLLNKNYLGINEELFFTNHKYFYFYLSFFNKLDILFLKNNNFKFNNLNFYWLTLLYNI